MRAQTVVQLNQTADFSRSQALQETPQRGLFGELLQPEHFQKGAVVLQYFGFVDPAQSHNNGIEQGQNHVRRVIFAALRGNKNIPLQQVTQLQSAAKTLYQPHPAEVREMPFLEGKHDFSGPFWHMTQNTLLGYFVSWLFLCQILLYLPTSIQRSKSFFTHVFTLF